MAESTRSVEQIFNALSGQPGQVQVSEQELKKGPAERTKQCYFVSPQLQTIYNNLPEETQKRLKWYGEEYYSRVIDQANYDLEIEARKLRNLVRAGHPFKDLTEDEQMIIRKFYGNRWFEDIGMTSEDE